MSALEPVESDPRGEERELTAAGRVLAILDVFRTHHIPLTLSEISRVSGISMTTTHRLTHELLDWSALERTPDGRYQLGTKMLELATSSGTAMRVREKAMPWLVRLHQMLRGLVVHLTVRDGDESVYVEALRSANGVVSMNRLGGRMPLHLTATGRVLLAYAGPAVQERVLSAPLQSFTPYTTTDPDDLRAEFELIRETQSVTTRSQVTVGTGGIASPVFDREGGVVAAVGIVVALRDHKIEDYVPLVRSTAAKISRAMDYVDAVGD